MSTKRPKRTCNCRAIFLQNLLLSRLAFWFFSWVSWESLQAAAEGYPDPSGPRPVPRQAVGDALRAPAPAPASSDCHLASGARLWGSGHPSCCSPANGLCERHVPHILKALQKCSGICRNAVLLLKVYR